VKAAVGMQSLPDMSFQEATVITDKTIASAATTRTLSPAW
jgi:hypothetical protein